MPEKPKKPQALFRVQFWEENREHEPLRTEYLYAPVEKEWADTRRGVLRILKWGRGAEQAKQDKVWLSHLLAREDVYVSIQIDEEWAAKQKAKQESARQTRILERKNRCQECGAQLDDDYCQSCGWRRQASWLEKAMGKQG